MSDNYDALSDRELTWLAAEHLFGYVWVCDDDLPGCWLQQCVSVGRSLATGTKRPIPARMQTPWRDLDDNAARIIRGRIAELGLWSPFVHALGDGIQFLPYTLAMLSMDACIQRCMQATPRQQCVAALRAKESTNG